MAPETQETDVMEQAAALEEVFGGETEPNEQREAESSEASKSEQQTETEATEEQAATPPVIDWDSVDGETIPHDVVNRTPAFQGLLASHQREREATRDLREQVQQLTGALGNRQTEAAEQWDEDEPATLGRVAELVEKRVESALGKIREQTKAQADTARQNQIAQSIEQAKAKYAKAPKGLDYDAVVREGSPWLEKHMPWLAKAIVNEAPDPAGMTYSLARAFVPSLRNRAQAARNQRVVDQVSGHGAKPPKTGVTTGSTESESGVDELSKMLNSPSQNEDHIFEDWVVNPGPDKLEE